MVMQLAASGGGGPNEGADKAPPRETSEEPLKPPQDVQCVLPGNTAT